LNGVNHLEKQFKASFSKPIGQHTAHSTRLRFQLIY